MSTRPNSDPQSTDTTQHDHRILKLWYRPEEGGTPLEAESLDLVAGRGVQGDHTLGGQRHVTIIFEDDWRAAANEAGKPDLDPIGRRANVLVSGGAGQRLVKAALELGGTRLDAIGITAPCGIMDAFHQGLKDALMPDGRAGIWCRISEGGTVRIGDSLSTVE